MKQLTFVIDADRCIGCKGCQVACKLENEVALGAGRNKVCTIGPTGTYPNLQMYFLTTMCQQCQDPPCVYVCPTGACYKNEEDGVINIDKDLCINCGSCRRECPYKTINLNKELRVSDKCTLCVEARAIDDVPACIRNCSGGALFYGDVNDPESQVSKMLAAENPDHIYSLKDFGNGPTTKYILRHADWVDVMPQDIIEHAAHMKGGRKAW